MTDEIAKHCHTCNWWSDLPALATGSRRPGGSDEAVGACCFNPPEIVTLGSGLFAAMFPETHAQRFCAAWELPDAFDGPDDPGGGEEVDTVVPFRTAA